MVTIKKERIININNNASNILERTTFIRDIYRSLLQNGRTYAAFEPDRVIPLVKLLASREEILDPMAGYGSLTLFCAKEPHPLSAFCVEYNPPAYFWQVLNDPRHLNKYLRLIKFLLDNRNEWPFISKTAASSNDWFPKESLEILLKLWTLCEKFTSTLHLKKQENVEIILAFLLPFVGRFSTCVPGNIVANIKKGGICIYKNWEEDFLSYIQILSKNLDRNLKEFKNLNHKIVYGNCVTIKLPQKRFSAMITSPPYPTGVYYYTMFNPENEFIKFLEEYKIVKGLSINERLIGDPRVSEKDSSLKKSPSDVKSKVARDFLDKVENYKGTQTAIYDNKIYYLPSFCRYFYQIEKAYLNIAPSLADNFEGYIIVVNNTHRKIVIPVAQILLEIWNNLGFNAEIVDDYTRELSHVGGINPHVKGLAARHTEYTIRVFK